MIHDIVLKVKENLAIELQEIHKKGLDRSYITLGTLIRFQERTIKEALKIQKEEFEKIIDKWAKPKYMKESKSEDMPVPSELKGLVKPFKRKTVNYTFVSEEVINELKEVIQKQ